MFGKLKIALRKKLFPCEQVLKSLFEDHHDAINKNIAARERLQAACQAGQVCYNANVKSQAQR